MSRLDHLLGLVVVLVVWFELVVLEVLAMTMGDGGEELVELVGLCLVAR